MGGMVEPPAGAVSNWDERTVRYAGELAGKYPLAAKAFPMWGASDEGMLAGMAAGRRGGVVERVGETTDPRLAAMQQQLSALQNAAAAGTSSSSVSVKEGRPVDQAYLASVRQRGSDYIQQRGEVLREQRDINAKHDDLLRTYAEDAKAVKQGQQALSGQAFSDYKETLAALKKGRDELAGMKVDPDRYWNSMPRSQQVMMAIGNMLGEAGQQASSGKITNEIGRWLKTATQQDIALQREAIKMKINDVEMTAKERDTLWNQWSHVENQIRSATSNMAKMELARIALATDNVGLKSDLAKAIYSIGSDVGTAAHGEYVANQRQVARTSSSTSGAGRGGKGGAGGEIEAPIALQTKLQNAVPALRGLERLKSALEKYNPLATMGTSLSGEETRLFEAVQEPTASAWIKAMTGQSSTEQEYRRRKKSFILGYDPTGKFGERSRTHQLAKIEGLRQQIKAEITPLVRSYPQLATRLLMADPQYAKEFGIDPSTVAPLPATRGRRR